MQSDINIWNIYRLWKLDIIKNYIIWIIINETFLKGRLSTANNIKTKCENDN